MGKKLTSIVLLIIFMFSFALYPIPKIEAKTIADLEEELERQEQELEENESAQTKTKEEMDAINANIRSIQISISETMENIKNLNNEIEELNIEIEEKKEEIKRIINFNQISNGESAYLEYIFGAQDFTDLIYRAAIAEQLTAYNDKLVEEYNAKIDENIKKTKDLEVEQAELAKKQTNLEREYAALGNSLQEITDESLSIKDAIKMNQELIEEYKKLGCGIDEEFSDCLSRLNTLPPDTQFWRPLTRGTITSKFGYRLLNGSGNDHQGLDIGASIGTPVYAVANGVVVATYAVGGTGNAVYVRHNVNGKHYTSIYMHLSAYNVSLNDVVTKDSIVGYSGCTGNCFGPHLHLGMLTGYAGVWGDSTADFAFWSNSFYANLVDPETLINFPSNYGTFTDRTSYYR